MGEVNEGIEVDYSHDNISEKTDKDYQLEFENKRDKKYFRKLLFYGLFAQ